MSAKVTIWAWKQAERLPNGTVLLTLLALADIARDHGKVWASHGYIAKKAKQGERTVRAGVTTLEGLGLLRTDPNPGRPDTIWLNLTAITLFEDGAGTDEPGALEKGPRRPRQEVPTSEIQTPACGADTPAPGAGAPAGGADEPRKRTNKGTSDLVLCAPDPFDAWWAAYPRKMAKVAARKAWVKVPAALAAQGLTLATLMERTRAFADHVVGKDAEHIAHPATWLNGERWNDELPDRSQTDGQSTRPAGGVDRGEQRAAARLQAMVEGARYAADPRSGRRRWKV